MSIDEYRASVVVSEGQDSNKERTAGGEQWRGKQFSSSGKTEGFLRLSLFNALHGGVCDGAPQTSWDWHRVRRSRINGCTTCHDARLASPA